MFLFRPHGTCDGDGPRYTAHRATGTQGCRQPPVDAHFLGHKEDHQEGRDRHNGSLDDGDRSRPHNQGEGQGGAQQHDTGLDVVLDPKPRIHPLRQTDDVGDEHSEQQCHQRRLQVVVMGLIPGADHEYDN